MMISPRRGRPCRGAALFICLLVAGCNPVDDIFIVDVPQAVAPAGDVALRCYFMGDAPGRLPVVGTPASLQANLHIDASPAGLRLSLQTYGIWSVIDQHRTLNSTGAGFEVECDSAVTETVDGYLRPSTGEYIRAAYHFADGRRTFMLSLTRETPYPGHPSDHLSTPWDGSDPRSMLGVERPMPARTP